MGAYSSAGVAYVQLGFASGLVDVRTLPSITAEGSIDQLGTVIAAIPDWTGDGGDEIAIGASSAQTDAGTNYGRLYVIASEDLY
jgi:hypothetical protein